MKYPFARFQVEAEFISDGRVLVKVKLTGRYTVQVRKKSCGVTFHFAHLNSYGAT